MTGAAWTAVALASLLALGACRSGVEVGIRAKEPARKYGRALVTVTKSETEDAPALRDDLERALLARIAGARVFAACTTDPKAGADVWLVADVSRVEEERKRIVVDIDLIDVRAQGVLAHFQAHTTKGAKPDAMDVLATEIVEAIAAD